ncbi:MAG: hypothetical protein LBT62_00075 [Deltaproteobacteria bacterium]|jgi:hypothetical protein|nr:hypothetical protein [Deltaproteobacteria bacterium]
MANNSELPLKIAREMSLKFLERRLLNVAKLPLALESFGKSAQKLLIENEEEKIPALSLAFDLTARLIEKGRLGTIQAAIDTLTDLTAAIREIAADIQPHKAAGSIKTAVDLVLKLLETNAISPPNVVPALKNLSDIAASVLADEKKTKPNFKGQRSGAKNG